MTQDFVPEEGLGEKMHRLVERLYPIPRSITGNGVRETLRIIGEHLPLQIHEVPTGTKVLDWEVPREWNIRDAYIKDPGGMRVVDFGDSSLHVVGYSLPVRARMALSDLKGHLHTLPDHPDWIPYRTSYYSESWGFCLQERRLAHLDEGVYEVCIDSTLEDGYLTYGEHLVEGRSKDEVLLSCHICHPAMCNDNLSGTAVATYLGRHLDSLSPRYTYRILFLPATIGSITWLALNEEIVPRIRHGLVLACLGDPGPITYKRSRRGDAEIDRAAEHVLRLSGDDFAIRDFSPYGYDERQYCSPGYNLPVGALHRTPHGEYPEYHTSADDLEFVRPEHLADSLSRALRILGVIDRNGTYLNLKPRGEPQLGRRGLYRRTGGKAADQRQLALLWVLNLSDGDHSLLDIAERSGLPFGEIHRAAEELLGTDLLKEVPG